MRLEKGSGSTDLSQLAVGLIDSAYLVHEDGFFLPLCQVRIEEIEKIRKNKKNKNKKENEKVCAMPTLVAFTPTSAEFFPKADKDYVWKLRYYPSMREE